MNMNTTAMKLKLRLNKRNLLVLAACVALVAATTIGWFAGRGRAQFGASLPPGAVPIAAEYTPAYDKAISDFQDAQKKANDANNVIQQIITLSLGRVGAPLDSVKDYRLDQGRKALIPLTAEDKAKAKKQQELQEQYNKQLSGL